MANFLKLHFHPLGGRILFWNLALLILIKLVLPNSTFQMATILDQISLFNSREIINLTNQVRADNNLPSLQTNFQLDTAASEKLNDMIRNNYFAHTSPSGTSPWFWIKQAEYNYNVAGENLAIGFFTAKDTVDAWIKSPAHKANLLNTKYRDIGVAVGRGKINNSEGIVIVQMFGSPSAFALKTTPFASSLLRPSLLPQPTLLAEKIAGAESVFLTVQAVSTDEEIPTVKNPLSISNGEEKRITDLVSTINLSFSFYTLILTVISVVSFMFFNKNSQMALRVLSHANLFLLSIVLAGAEMHLETLIF